MITRAHIQTEAASLSESNSATVSKENKTSLQKMAIME